MQVKNFNKDHRTALVIDVNEFDDSDYRDRVKRLLQSVNGPNIKTDIFALRNDVLTQVSDFEGIKDVVGSTTVTSDPTDSVRQWASEAGYTQVIVNSAV